MHALSFWSLSAVQITSLNSAVAEIAEDSFLAHSLAQNLNFNPSFGRRKMLRARAGRKMLRQ